MLLVPPPSLNFDFDNSDLKRLSQNFSEKWVKMIWEKIMELIDENKELFFFSFFLAHLLLILFNICSFNFIKTIYFIN